MAALDAAWTAALAADPDAVGLGPYTAADADAEAVNTRFVSGIPNQYVELVMSNQGCTPHTFWELVVGQIRADGNEGACSALVNWARVACSFSVANSSVLLGHGPQPDKEITRSHLREWWCKREDFRTINDSKLFFSFS